MSQDHFFRENVEMYSPMLQIALETYHDARIRGLCHEGALEAALGAAPGVDPQRLLGELKNLGHDLPHKTIHEKLNGKAVE